MMLLVCFDLPRATIKNRKDATKYRKRLVELGFTMKQFSLYEREIRQTDTRRKVIATLSECLPEEGQITLYELPDEVNDQQITILGEKVARTTFRRAKFLVL
ncbi:CRISPR-associated endonuclease Cas2 [Enterococcus italicus]|uniref:CRISPR-associated endoribonuclease Cas2 n=1 Tax=Enterococcus italicus (strain DSM 15952 / CCUG 50447 / LMG 22039 / TP 1.5) TaxID=888064 RepID=E6LHV8_ENTI1|nr:CRISPR-associated endonuclease Cas2 [Enterococcus italicus]EFU73218.1 CRISPR-associated endoribonuclease Cas2 [Enterococcus italicus DSM 15952]MCM6880185.1 CRISPR-associated endonuclease Cas2 [Enterococcus italicus]